MTAKWLKTYGACLECHRKADGILMDEHNGQIGPYCRKHAEQRIARDIERPPPKGTENDQG